MPTRTLTDTWLDVHAAAAYAGVPFTVIAAALADHELPALTPDPDRPATSNVALVPIGTPLLAGPGAIVATMLFVQRAHGPGGYGAIALGIALVLLSVWLILRFSGLIVRVLRPAGIEVLTRIAGLLLAAIAVQLIADAVAAFIHAY